MKVEILDSNTAVLRIRRELTFTQLQDLSIDLVELNNQNFKKFIIDLKDVENFNSEIIGTFLSLRQKLPDSVQVEIINTSDWIKKSLELMGLERIFTIH